MKLSKKIKPISPYHVWALHAEEKTTTGKQHAYRSTGFFTAKSLEIMINDIYKLFAKFKLSCYRSYCVFE